MKSIKAALFVMAICTMALTFFSSAHAFLGMDKFAKEVEKETGAVKLVREVMRGGYDLVTTTELKQWMDEKKEMIIVDTMPYESSYKKAHVPGAAQFLFPIPDMAQWDTAETAGKTSAEFETLLGTDKNKIIGKHCSLTRNDNAKEQLVEMVDQVIKGESLRGVYTERKCFDGTNGRHILSMNPTFEEGEIVGAEGFIIDISDIANAQEQMYHSVRNSQAGYYKVDMNGYYIDVNDAWLRMYKCEDRNNVIGKHYSMTRNDDDLKRADDIFNLVTKKGETLTSEIATRRCKDGTTAKHILSANPVYDCELIIGMEGFIIDISDLDIEKEA